MNKEKKLLELKALVEGAEISLQQARGLIAQIVGDESAVVARDSKKIIMQSKDTEEGKVIEGLFDGQNMVGPDGKKYSVPANYASKSKLVEGDGLKLTITNDGTFVYKQIHLLDRDRLVGDLIIDEQTDEYRVIASGKSYKVLTASITYFKGEPGDKVTILLPKGRETTWAAVENILQPGEDAGEEDEIATREDGENNINEKIAGEEKEAFAGVDEKDESSDDVVADEGPSEEVRRQVEEAIRRREEKNKEEDKPTDERGMPSAGQFGDLSGSDTNREESFLGEDDQSSTETLPDSQPSQSQLEPQPAFSTPPAQQDFLQDSQAKGIPANDLGDKGDTSNSPQTETIPAYAPDANVASQRSAPQGQPSPQGQSGEGSFLRDEDDIDDNKFDNQGLEEL